MFPDVEIFATMSQELSGSHFVEILPIVVATSWASPPAVGRLMSSLPYGQNYFLG